MFVSHSYYSIQKHVNGKADFSGPAVQLGCEERYFPTCFDCYNTAIESIGESLLTKRKRDTGIIILLNVLY
jgi:thymidine kinase